jgi:hypothetical protein
MFTMKRNDETVKRVSVVYISQLSFLLAIATVQVEGLTEALNSILDPSYRSWSVTLKKKKINPQ